MDKTRCGFIAIAGEPNAGKSTLINRLAGGKVSIVTPKAQTTRFNVRGVCVEGDAQMIFVDTPGIFAAEKNFEKAMVQAAWSGIGDADAALLLVDARKGLRDSTVRLIEKLRSSTSLLSEAGGGKAAHDAPSPTLRGKGIYLALNKIDTIDKTTLFELAKACDAFGIFKRIFMISALKGDGVGDVKKHLAAAVPEGAWLYPEDQMSDIPLRLLAAEVTREKIFLKLEQELPYAAFVETEAWEETDTFVKISQVIVVQREGQKKIIIGDKGAMIKNIGIASRRELEKMLGKRIHLALFVKVRAGWKDDIESYRALGLEYRK
ncbi:MAG: GTPase Era [Pseudomonadota bacterium]|nr:GTPase Era [Pseudomonadota bacterium]MDE3036904.1 GTPase Era [Pseudomonadota bacterium]